MGGKAKPNKHTAKELAAKLDAATTNRGGGKATMGGKAKPNKHTAKELAAKLDAATTNRGGGKAGLADRIGIEKGGHANLECPHCKITAPDIKTMQIHHDTEHPKTPFNESKLSNLHATTNQVVDISKPVPSVRGSL